MAKKRTAQQRTARRRTTGETLDDASRDKKLDRLRNKLLKLLKKRVRGIKRLDQITNDNVHLIHERIELIHEVLQELMPEISHGAVLDMTGVELKNANLVGANFFRMNLEGANLEGAFGGDFGHANLKHANLRKVQIKDVAHADLTDADLHDAELQECCLLGTNLNRANLSGVNLCGADLTNIKATRAIWDNATFDAKTRFSPSFKLPKKLVWVGSGQDSRTKARGKKKTSTKRTTKKANNSPKRPGTSKRKEEPRQVSLKSLITDKQLAKLCADLKDDSALPEGMDASDFQHPIYGPDLGYTIALEYCPNRFRELDLPQHEFDFNTWYRAERFAQMFDAAENCYSDGDHDRAERLMPEMTGELCQKAFKRIEREVKKAISLAKKQ